MSPDFLYLLILTGLILMMSSTYDYFSSRKKFRKSIIPEEEKMYRKKTEWCLRATIKIALATILLFIVAVATSKILTEVVILNQDNTVSEVVENEVLWRWSNRLKDKNIIDYSLSKEQSLNFAGPQSLTDNPKIRTIHYDIHYVIGGTPELGKAFYIQTGGWRIRRYDDTKIQSLLYEFNEAHSVSIGKFYNPMDESQQEGFEELFRSSCEKQFTELGCTLESVRFAIP